MKRFAMLASLVSAFALCGIQAAGAATGSDPDARVRCSPWSSLYTGAGRSFFHPALVKVRTIEKPVS